MAGEELGALLFPAPCCFLWALAFLMLAGFMRAGRRER